MHISLVKSISVIQVVLYHQLVFGKVQLVYCESVMRGIYFKLACVHILSILVTYGYWCRRIRKERKCRYCMLFDSSWGRFKLAEQKAADTTRFVPRSPSLQRAEKML